MVDGKFGKYEIRDVLGVGGMATVYRAYDPDFEREVALKILRREMLENQQLRDRFEREIKIIARLEHEAIVPVYDTGRDRDQLFYVMRLMTGGSLSDRMHEEPMPADDIIHIVQRIAPALDLAHQRNIIHRDLKPANILFDDHGNAFISDFGIAKFVNAPHTLTKDGIIGTPTYMSPEQAQGDDVDGRSDVYSLAVIVFELLSGKTPFEATTPMKIVLKHITDPPPHIRDYNSSLSPAVEAVLMKAMAKDREDRYSTGVEFANELTAALLEPWSPPVEPVRPLYSRPGFWVATGIVILGIIVFGLRNGVNPHPDPTRTSVAATITETSWMTDTPIPVPPRSITTNTPVTPVFVPPGGADKIAFTANDEIYLANYDGSGIESLTKTGIPKLDLQWIPNTDELLYIEANCVNRIDASQDPKEPEKLICFNDSDFTGFRVSPDGTRVAISIAGRLLVLPYDLDTLSTAPSAFELQRLENVCMNYTDVTVKDALWSDDGKRLAIRYQSVVNGRIGDTIRVIQGNWARCQQADVFTWDEFPAERFTPDGYARYPILPSYSWDGEQRFLMNSFIRNRSYGDLYSYDLASRTAKMINPIDGACCYGSAAYSPDGTHMLLVFQDEGNAPDNETVLYYIPVDQIGTGEELTPLPVSSYIFEDWRENIQLALHPVRQ